MGLTASKPPSSFLSGGGGLRWGVPLFNPSPPHTPPPLFKSPFPLFPNGNPLGNPFTINPRPAERPSWVAPAALSHERVPLPSSAGRVGVALEVLLGGWALVWGAIGVPCVRVRVIKY